MDKAELFFHLAREDGLEFVFTSGGALAYPMHTHVTAVTLTVVRRGVVRLLRGSECCVYPRGSAYSVAPHEPHSPAYADGFDLVSLCVDKNHFRAMPLCALSGLCLQYMRSLAAKGLLAPENIRSLLDCLSEAYGRLLAAAEPVPPVCGSESGVSPSQGIRRFRREMGITPHQFLVQNRIREAKELLARPHSIAEAALRAGFYDQSHLTRWFARNIGITPRRYRESSFNLTV